MWKDHNAVLSYNRALAEARLQYLKSRFDREPELEVKYRAVIEDWAELKRIRGEGAPSASIDSSLVGTEGTTDVK